jgi:hypothetical protein
MARLTAEQLAALPEEVKTFVAAIYIPSTGQLFACPNIAAPLHECPAAFTVPQAERLAAAMRGVTRDVHVLVYGVQWSP